VAVEVKFHTPPDWVGPVVVVTPILMQQAATEQPTWAAVAVAVLFLVITKAAATAAQA
jgi:uncharacterized protein (DUF983 family)